MSDAILHRARIVFRGDGNGVRIVGAETTEPDVRLRGIQFGSRLAQIRVRPIGPVVAAEKERVIGTDVIVVAVHVIVNAGRDDRLHGAVGIRLHVVIPATVIRLAGRPDGAVGENLRELQNGRRGLSKNIRVHQRPVGFEGLAVLDVAVIHAGAGVARMAIRCR